MLRTMAARAGRAMLQRVASLRHQPPSALCRPLPPALRRSSPQFASSLPPTARPPHLQSQPPAPSAPVNWLMASLKFLFMWYMCARLKSTAYMSSKLICEQAEQRSRAPPRAALLGPCGSGDSARWQTRCDSCYTWARRLRARWHGRSPARGLRPQGRVLPHARCPSARPARPLGATQLVLRDSPLQLHWQPYG